MMRQPACHLLLVADGDAEAAQVRNWLAGLPGWTVEITHVPTLAVAEADIALGAHDLVVLDLHPSPEREALPKVLRRCAGTPVVVVSDLAEAPELRRLAEEHEAYVLPKDLASAALFRRTVASILTGTDVRRSHDQLVDLVAALPDAVLVADLNGIVQYANDAARTLFDRDPADLIGESISFSVAGPVAMEIEVFRNGEPRSAEIRVKDCIWNRRPAHLAMIRDITEQKRLNEQLRQAQKMEAVGLLAGGIAHDFNNLLLVMGLYSEVLEKKLADVVDVQTELGEITNAIERAGALTRQLLTFSRRQPADLRPLNIAEVVTGFQSMLRRILPSTIEIVRRCETGIWPVTADRGHIEQVIMNLAVNARDAMPEGGRFTLSVRNVRRPAIAQGNEPEEVVELRVEDTGIGMPPEVLSRIFEPFFTTKERGRGTGLGLATCYGIIAQAGGRILVDSKPGHGTAFTIHLPRSSDLTGQEGDDDAPAEDPMLGDEAILVVEDDRSAGRATATILGQAGYRVRHVTNGEEARRILDQDPDQFDLVLTDVVMPQLSGPELARHIRSRYPDLPVVIMTGYSDDAIARDGADLRITGRPALLKPFGRGELLRIVRDALDGGAGEDPA